MLRDVVEDAVQLLHQQAMRERAMAAGFRGVGRTGLARYHESRAVGFEEAAQLVREHELETRRAQGADMAAEKAADLP